MYLSMVCRPPSSSMSTMGTKPGAIFQLPDVAPREVPTNSRMKTPKLLKAGIRNYPCFQAIQKYGLYNHFVKNPHRSGFHPFSKEHSSNSIPFCPCPCKLTQWCMFVILILIQNSVQILKLFDSFNFLSVDKKPYCCHCFLRLTSQKLLLSLCKFLTLAHSLMCHWVRIPIE